MRTRKMSYGEKGWIGLAAYVIFVDALAWAHDQETMSVSFGKWLQNPRSRRLTGAAWAIVTLHLFYSLPLPGQTTLKNVVRRMFPR